MSEYAPRHRDICPPVSDRPAPSAAGPSDAAIIAAAKRWNDAGGAKAGALTDAIRAAYAVDFPARPTGGERARALAVEAMNEVIESHTALAKEGGSDCCDCDTCIRYGVEIRALAGTPERDET